MAVSMTGYGSAELHDQAVAVSVEIKAVNSRNLDLNLKSPFVYYPFEVELQNYIRKHYIRGRFDIYITRKVLDSKAEQIHVNAELFKAYWDQITSSLKSVGTGANQIDPTNLGIFILNKNELIKSSVSEEQLDAEKSLLLDCFRQACDKLTAAREQEGQGLQTELLSVLTVLKEIKAKIDKCRTGVIAALYEDLLSKLKKLFSELDFTSERIEQEAALRLEKADISEELARIDLHLQALEQETKQQASGKKIEFYSQELKREFNTISAKANQAEVQQLVVDAKLEVEKIREQSFNLE